MAKRFNPIERLINRVFDKQSMISDELLEEKMRSYSKVSLSYFLLLTSSFIIATLGLLMNASAIVIGSMIISPLTWPMFGLADGAALGNRKRIKANLIILVGSVAFGVILAYLLTVFSPLKVVNEEILARSQPTLLDAVVAMTAGGIGILAIIRRNISDTVAGVAVALSLTPPLCVVGISLALGESSIVQGSFLLLLTNALSITFVAALILVPVHYSWRRKLHTAPKAFAIMLVSLLITAIPLYQLLKVYSLETSSYAVVQTELDSYIKNISPNGSVQNIRTNLENRSGDDVLVIDAGVFLPSSVSLTYQDKDMLASNLNGKLDRIVDLRLRIQNISQLTNIEDLNKQAETARIRSSFSTHLQELNKALRINDIDIAQTNDVWFITAQLSGNQTSVPSEQTIAELDRNIEKELGIQASLAVSYVPITEIKTELQTITDSLKSELQSILRSTLPSATISNLSIRESEGTDVVNIELKLRNGEEISLETAQTLKQTATVVLQGPVELRIQRTYFEEDIY